MGYARSNARAVRTALTREVFEAVNDTWRRLGEALSREVGENALPGVLRLIRDRNALVRGALYGTMLRNEIFHFSRLGAYVERADSTARILDVKYYVLLPSVKLVGTQVDNAQWETVLRSVSAHRSYMWLHGGDVTAGGIARFLIFDPRMPRSLAYCYDRIDANLGELERMGGGPVESRRLVAAMRAERLDPGRAEEVIDEGLHEVLTEFKRRNNEVGSRIEADFGFYG